MLCAHVLKCLRCRTLRQAITASNADRALVKCPRRQPARGRHVGRHGAHELCFVCSSTRGPGALDATFRLILVMSHVSKIGAARKVGGGSQDRVRGGAFKTSGGREVGLPHLSSSAHTRKREALRNGGRRWYAGDGVRQEDVLAEFLALHDGSFELARVGSRLSR